MKINSQTDIDLDFADRKQILELIPNVPAMLNTGKKHNTGVYFHDMPNDPTTGLATLEHKRAEELGFFKIDCLNVGLYKDVKNELHLVQLMNTEPVWSLLEHEEFVDKLFHVNGHHELLAKLRPQSIEDLSCVLAIIRPSKRHLADSDWNTIRNQVWVQPDNDEYFFKRSHAIAYATAIVVQMNLLCEGIV